MARFGGDVRRTPLWGAEPQGCSPLGCALGCALKAKRADATSKVACAPVTKQCSLQAEPLTTRQLDRLHGKRPPLHRCSGSCSLAKASFKRSRLCGTGGPRSDPVLPLPVGAGAAWNSVFVAPRRMTASGVFLFHGAERRERRHDQGHARADTIGFGPTVSRLASHNSGQYSIEPSRAAQSRSG